MPAVTVHIINAFTDAGQGGNPAGVVLEADRLNREVKQQIAARVGISETAFVSSSRTADFKLEFFTPTRQIAHCGHATIAAFSYLAQQGLVTGSQSSKETIDGNRNIFLHGDIAFMEQTAPRYRALAERAAEGVNKATVLYSLGLNEWDLLAGYGPIVVNTGNSFMIVPLRDRQTLKQMRPVWEAVEHISESLELIGYYAFSLQTEVSYRDATARMFAPRYGIREESATGMAAGPLACYLYDYVGLSRPKMVVEQGRLMSPPSPSELLVELTAPNGQITGLIAGGRARLMRTIELEFTGPFKRP